MQPEESSLSKSLLQAEGVTLLILSATVYTAFLVREMGYAEHFSIPQDLIVTSHIGLVSAAKALLGGVIAYIGKVNIIWMFAPRGDRLLPFVLRRTIGAVLIIGFAMYPYLITGLSWWWFVGLIGLIVFFSFVWPLILVSSDVFLLRKIK